MDDEALRILRGKYRARDKALEKAAAQVKRLADEIQKTFSEISANDKIVSEVVIYTTCVNEVDGQPPPVFTLFGDHRGPDMRGVMATVQQALAQMGLNSTHVSLSAGSDASIESVKAEDQPKPDAPPTPGLLHGFIPAHLPKVRHVHKVEAEIGLAIKDSHRGKTVLRVHDIVLLDDAAVTEIMHAIVTRLSGPDGFLDEFILEINGGYGLGPKLSEEQELMRRVMRKQKKEFDDEERWRGGEEEQ